MRGLSLHDLRFRGERIVYELAAQEMYVSYNGYGGVHMSAPCCSSQTLCRRHALCVVEFTMELSGDCCFAAAIFHQRIGRVFMQEPGRRTSLTARESAIQSAMPRCW